MLTEGQLNAYALVGLRMEIAETESKLATLREKEKRLKKVSESVAGTSLKSIRKALKKKPATKKSTRKPGQRKWSAKDREATSVRMKKFWVARRAAAQKATK